MNTEEKNKTKQNKRQVVGVLKNVMREDRKGREGSLAAIARGTPYVCVCVLHIKPFFYSSTSSTPSVRTDSSP